MHGGDVVKLLDRGGRNTRVVFTSSLNCTQVLLRCFINTPTIQKTATIEQSGEGHHNSPTYDKQEAMESFTFPDDIEIKLMELH